MNFDFLKNVELNVVPAKTSEVRAPKVQRNPDKLTLRVFASGKIYPSQDLVDLFNLEYVPKDSTGTANGMDVFKSIDWPMFPASAPDQYIFVGIVPKKLPKVDLFGQVGYEEDGSPKSSVMEQGGGSFGAQFLEMIKEVYGIEIEKGSYKDFAVGIDLKIKSPNDLYFVPKTVARGEKKGEVTVVRREAIDIMPLIPIVNDEVAACYDCDTEEVIEETSEVPQEELMEEFGNVAEDNTDLTNRMYVEDQI